MESAEKTEEVAKILIVEDEVKTANYLKKGLEAQGYFVEAVFDGEAGLQLALQSEFDLIVLDVLLPSRDGWSVLTELRNAGKKNLTLFLTACDTVDERINGLELGADAYLVKPFAFAEFLAHVRSLLRRNPQRKGETVIQVADLSIDLVNRIAIRSGVRLDLTPKEFALLFLLMRRRGEVLSRTIISEEVWKIHHDSGTNSVDVHIRRLRSKVDDQWEKKLIKTVRGSGYSIGDPT